MKLVYNNSHANHEPGTEVKAGDKVMTFRGETVEVISVTEPHKSSSTGRVYLQFFDKVATDEVPANYDAVASYKQEVFPGVISAEWVEREDRA